MGLVSLLVASDVAGIVIGVVVALVVISAIFARLSFTVVTQYQRAVIFRFGRVLSGAKGPGLIRLIPLIDRPTRVNLRVEVVDIPPQGVITKDNVTIMVDAVAYFQVMDPIRAVVGVDNFRFASQRVAMTSLRSIIGRYELDSLLAHREDVNAELREAMARSTTEWGVDVRQVQIRDINLPPELLRAMARQAEAERERRAKVIAATGELQASTELAEAAHKLDESPGALQLRTLQTLAEVATEHNSTLVFPLPVELLRFFDYQSGGTATPYFKEGGSASAPARPGEAEVSTGERPPAEVGPAPSDQEPAEVPETSEPVPEPVPERVPEPAVPPDLGAAFGIYSSPGDGTGLPPVDPEAPETT